MNLVSTITRGAVGEDSITTGSSAWPPTRSWRPSELGFPPQSLLPSCAALAYPKVSARGDLPLRVERHNPASITTMRLLHARTLSANLPACPWCGHHVAS